MNRLSVFTLAMTVLLLLLAFLTPICASGTTYYVRTDGHDGASGLNNTNDPSTGAWKTINKAAVSYQPGDTINVTPGRYDEVFIPSGYAALITLTNCTADNPCLFTCTEKWGCLIRTDASTVSDCLIPNYTVNCVVWDSRGQYITIKDFDISGTNVSEGILAAGSHSRVIGNRVHDLPIECNNHGGGGIIPADLRTNSDVDVIGNLIYGIGKSTTVAISSISRDTSGLVTVQTSNSHRIYSSSDEVLISGVSTGSGLSFNGRFQTESINRPIDGTLFTYRQAPGFAGTGTEGTSTNTTCAEFAGIFQQIPGSKLQNNIIHSGTGQGIGADTRSANLTVTNNLIFSNENYGIVYAGRQAPFSLATNSLFANNIVVDNWLGGIFEQDLLDVIPAPAVIGPGNRYLHNIVVRNSSLRLGTRGVVVCNGADTGCAVTSAAIISASCSGDTATLTAQRAETITQPGWPLIVSGITTGGDGKPNYNGSFTVTAKPSNTQIQYALACNSGNEGTGGSYTSSLVSERSGTLEVDPLLVNYQRDGSGDYHLSSGSPAIGAGVPDGCPPTDFDGNVRDCSRPSIGPYDYESSDFALAVASGTTEATLQPGQSTASYSLQVVSLTGFAGAVNISCAAAPPQGTCTTSVTSVNPGVPFTVNVSITRASVLPREPQYSPPSSLRPRVLFILLLVVLVWLVEQVTTRRLRPSLGALGTLALLLLLTASIGCAFVSGGGHQGAGAGTPTGNYSLTVTGSSHGVNHSLSLTLHVN